MSKNNKFTISNKTNSKVIDYKCKYDLTKKESIEKLNKLTSNYIKDNINNLLTFIKDNNKSIGKKEINSIGKRKLYL